MPIIVFIMALAIGATPGPQRYPDAWRDYLGGRRMVRDEVIPRLQQTAFPDTLILVGTYATSGKARDVWVNYPYAYLASDWLGVEVVDISDPTNPTLVRTIDTPGQAYDVQMKDSLIYEADDYSGFQILSDWSIVGGHDTPRICRGVFVRDTLLYVADFESLLVFDVADPAVPGQIGSVVLDEFRDAAAIAIYVNGIYAYLADPVGGMYLMWIVDVSDPTSPLVAGLYIDPDYWFFPRNVYVRGQLAYVANYYNELFIINVANPAKPVRAGLAYPPSELWGFAWDVKLRGDYAYVANYDGGLWVVDVSDPGNTKSIAVYNTPGLASGVFVDSDYIYVADYYSLLIFEESPKGVQEKGLSSKASDLRLCQNDPNPFSELTIIRYELPSDGPVSVKVYDIAGRLTRTLADGETKGGTYSARWDGTDEAGQKVPAGVYFCRLQVGQPSRAIKMVLVR